MIRKLTCIIIAFILIFFSYIFISSIFINKNSYVNISWKIAKDDITIKGRDYTDVDIFKINNHLSMSRCENIQCKISRVLLHLNGNHAVRITFESDSIIGPHIIYVNPFTKQIIGGESRQ